MTAILLPDRWRLPGYVVARCTSTPMCGRRAEGVVMLHMTCRRCRRRFPLAYLRDMRVRCPECVAADRRGVLLA